MAKFEINEKVYACCSFVHKLLIRHVVPLLPSILYIGIAFAIVFAAGTIAAYVVNYPKIALLVLCITATVAFIAVIVVKHCRPKEKLHPDETETTKTSQLKEGQ